MDDRLASQMLVGALIRRAQGQGGFATVLRRGDAISGAIIIATLERGRETGLFERVPDYTAGGYRLTPCGPADSDDPMARHQYMERRVRSDPDLWFIELDIAEAERFAAETIC